VKQLNTLLAIFATACGIIAFTVAYELKDGTWAIAGSILWLAAYYKEGRTE